LNNQVQLGPTQVFAFYGNDLFTINIHAATRKGTLVGDAFSQSQLIIRTLILCPSRYAFCHHPESFGLSRLASLTDHLGEYKDFTPCYLNGILMIS
jgi:hypothetical protein